MQPTSRQLMRRDRQQQKKQQQQSTEATNSEADPSDSLLLVNNSGRFVQKFFDRLKHSLMTGLLRRSAGNVLTDAHNAEAEVVKGTQADEGAAKPNDTKQNGRILSESAAAMKRAEKFYTVDTEAYDFRALLDFYAKEGSRISPRSLRFLIGRRAGRRVGGGDGDSRGTTATGCSLHPLLDRLVQEFCSRVGMQELTKMPMSEERIFLWLGRDRAQRMLGEIGSRSTGEQMYFVNRVNLDHVLTDLQCLCTRLDGCVARDGQVYPPHSCTDREKIREQYNGSMPVLPKMMFVGRQVLCRHVYLKQDFGTICDVTDCPNYGKRLCACFQLDMFIPDTMVLATKRKFEEVRACFTKNVYGDQRWLLRASNLKGGNGVQLIDKAAELETFMRYDLNRRMRGQFFVLQRYLNKPKLLEGKRFDLRMFLLVSVLTDRRVVAFLHPGYIRLAQKDYDAASNDLRCHLTWPFTWDPDYNRYKAVSGQQPGQSGQSGQSGQPEQQQQQQQQQHQQQQQQDQPDYCRPYSETCESLGLPRITCDRQMDTAMRMAEGDRFLHRLSRIVHYMTGQIDSIVSDKPGSWQLFGLDLVLDEDKEVWLHDVMSYPCLDEPDPRSETQNRVVPAVLTESLALVMELNQRDFVTRNSAQWLDLPDVPINQPGLIASQKNFVWMYSTDVERLISSKTQRQRVKSPHWYNRWRVTEDFNDYILYLKNYRINNFPLEADTTVYGRKSFVHSPAEQFRKMMKSTQSNVKAAPQDTPEANPEDSVDGMD